jgi:hypothetical protein
MCSLKGLRLSVVLQVIATSLCNNMTLINNDLITDLGVGVDSDLSYHAQIVSIVGKATQRVGILFRGFVTRDLKVSVTHYLNLNGA